MRMRMRQIHSRAGHAAARSALMAVVASMAWDCGHAGDFTLGDDIQGNWSLSASLGSSVRMQGRDPRLISAGNANHNGGVPGNGGGSTDDGDLNFNKHDVFSTSLKAVGDVDLRYRNVGALVRVKAWHDFTLAQKSVPHGSFDTAYVPDTKLNDDHFDRVAKFSGIDLLDAFVYGDWQLGEDARLNARLGNQVINWGESIFIQGVNVVSPIDVPAARRAGAQVKEILLPVPLAYANFGLPNGVSLEGFYQLKWKKTVIDGCGTFFSPADVINCGGSQFGPDLLSDQQLYQGVPGVFGGLNFRSTRLPDAKPQDGGQYGLAMHYLEPASQTDIGLYYLNYHTRTPFLSLSSKPSEPTSLYGTVAPLSYLIDYSAENIKTYGLSFSNTIGGVSVSAELSFTKDLPVQINGGDLVQFGISGGTQGPLAGRPYDPAGATILGYDRKNKIQLQFGAINVFSQVLGAQSLLVVGEAGFSWTRGLPDPRTGVRYGRAFTFGTAWSPAYSNPALSTAAGCQAANAAAADNPSNCDQTGFVTPFSWGYRLLGELEYPNAVGGWTLKPRVYWSHDVKGNSADGAFMDHRKTLGLGVAFSRLIDKRRWTLDVAYTNFLDGARWDTNRDKDFLAASVSVSF